jgi:hypothetical protein
VARDEFLPGSKEFDLKIPRRLASYGFAAAILRRIEEPPRPLKCIAEFLSLPIKELYDYHRDLAVAISSRHTDYIRECKAQSIEAMKADVRRIIFEIESRGEYPTVEYILSLIDSPFAEKPWIERKIIREVKIELNSVG